MTKKLARPPDAWDEPPYDKYDIAALQALAAGVANDVQQKQALNWIVVTVCGTFQRTFNDQSERISAFAEGKRHVGRMIDAATRLKVEKLPG